MLNNNAELDNGVYNDNEEEQKEAAKVTEEEENNDDGLAGPNMEQVNFPPSNDLDSVIPLSQQPSAFQSLNTSQVMIEDEKIERLVAEYGYQF